MLINQNPTLHISKLMPFKINYLPASFLTPADSLQAILAFLFLPFSHHSFSAADYFPPISVENYMLVIEKNFRA